MSTRRFAALELTDGFGVPAETTHRPSLEGRWWLVAGTPEGFSRAQLRSGLVEFRLRADGRLDLTAVLESDTRGRRRISSTVAARAGRRGRFSWRVRGRMGLLSLFTWSYRRIADDRLLITGHSGSIASQPTYAVLARLGLCSGDAMTLLGDHLLRIGVPPAEIRDLARFEMPDLAQRESSTR